MRDLRLFTGSANPQLARGICQYLDIELGCIDVSDFSDGEIFVQIRENVRGKDVFLLQPTCHPVNQHLMELLIMTDACRRASAARITAVLPYFGYSRQDRKDRPRVPITAKLVADLITAAGWNRRPRCSVLERGGCMRGRRMRSFPGRPCSAWRLPTWNSSWSPTRFRWARRPGRGTVSRCCRWRLFWGKRSSVFIVMIR